MKAGGVEVSYENGFLRYFKVNQTEVLRMIYFAVRDANWGNFEPLFFDEKIVENENSFSIKYKVRCSQNESAFFEWTVAINGLNTSEIHFEIAGETLQNFSTNRAGFCVLHPIEKIAGESVEITSYEGQKTSHVFPKFIAPHQPFFNIVGMNWAVEDSLFELHFSGDIFETEDQRNWGDASYKTYCTPLHLPFPKQMTVGEKVSQKVIFKAKIDETTSKNQLESPSQTKAFQIGIGESSSNKTLSIAGVEKLKTLNLSHFSIEIALSESNWKDKLLHQTQTAAHLEVALEVALILSDAFEEELQMFSEFVSNESLTIKHLTLISKGALVTRQSVIDQIPSLKSVFTNTKIGVGTLYNFTEINRERFDAKEADFISFSFDPQQHANDDLSIFENTETVKYLVESAREIYQKPIHISPILLKRRFNPYATDPSALKVPIENQIDSRQKTIFLAQWTKSLIENLAISGVASVTLFQTHGDLGIMNEDGDLYPVFQEIKNSLTNS
jgi:D-apionolactonase